MRRFGLLPFLGAALLLVTDIGMAAAQDKRLHVAAPEALRDTGFLKFLLPRFSLKNGIPISLVAPGEAAVAAFTDSGAAEAVPVFTSGGVTYYLAVAPEAADNPHLAKLLDWLESEIGRTAIAGFAGPPVFAPPEAATRAVAAEALPGNVRRGAELSLAHCGRCHVVGDQNRMKGIGSTPSFGVLRTLPDWRDRFDAFFALRPHPAFTRLEGVSPPFEAGRSPTIAPVMLTPGELEDILAYAASLAPADLGAPIQHQ